MNHKVNYKKKVRTKKFVFPQVIYFCMFLFLYDTADCQRTIELQRYLIKDSIRMQAVAVDNDFIYAVGTTSIIKFDKKNFEKAAEWVEAPRGAITHLNSGRIIKGKLYCAHSNFPQKPMLSSIEVFDTKTMKHIATHSFGFVDGSATWVDKTDGFWWVAFANYGGKHTSEGRDNKWTRLVKFSKDWNQIESWAFPPAALESFGLYSNSGGLWNRKGELYITGHDLHEIYVLKLPESGSTLRHLRTIQTINGGQGIDIEIADGKEILYGISKKEKAIIKQVIAVEATENE